MQDREVDALLTDRLGVQFGPEQTQDREQGVERTAQAHIVELFASQAQEIADDGLLAGPVVNAKGTKGCYEASRLSWSLCRPIRAGSAKCPQLFSWSA